jgi:hypothetical protein
VADEIDLGRSGARAYLLDERGDLGGGLGDWGEPFGLNELFAP